MAAEPRSDDYRRGYQSGITARNRKQWEIEQRHQAEVLAVAQRAERAESACGIGHCEDCQHWGQPANCHWGYCNAGEQPGSPHGCWAQLDGKKPATSPRFGCVLFLPKDGTTGVEGRTK